MAKRPVARLGLISTLRPFLSSEASSGILLLLAAALALLVANGPAGAYYEKLVHSQVGSLSVLHWVKDAAMANFFLLVGPEIKREFVNGRVRTWADRRPPIIAAASGMVLSALLYLGLAGGDERVVARMGYSGRHGFAVGPAGA